MTLRLYSLWDHKTWICSRQKVLYIKWEWGGRERQEENYQFKAASFKILRKIGNLKKNGWCNVGSPSIWPRNSSRTDFKNHLFKGLQYQHRKISQSWSIKEGRQGVRSVLMFAFLLFRSCSPNLGLVAQTVKNPPAMWETWVLSCWEDPLEEGMATPSSIVACRIPMDREAWQAAVHGVAKSRTRLSD